MQTVRNSRIHLREHARKVVQFQQLYKDPETKDVVWVQDVCSRGYIVITKDKRMLEHTNALMAWHRNKGKIFFLASGGADADHVDAAVLKALRKMEELIERMDGPFYVRVLLTGAIELVRPEALPALD